MSRRVADAGDLDPPRMFDRGGTRLEKANRLLMGLAALVVLVAAASCGASGHRASAGTGTSGAVQPDRHELPPLHETRPLPPLQAKRLRVESQTSVDSLPGTPAVGFGSVWVPAARAGVVDRIDPNTGTVLARIRSSVRAPCCDYWDDWDSVAISSAAVWHGSDRGHMVVKIDPRTNRAVARVRVGGRVGALSAAGDSVYVTLLNNTRVLRIDARSNRIVVSRDLESFTTGVAAVKGGLWVLINEEPAVLRLDPLSLRIRRRTPIPSSAPFVGGPYRAWSLAADQRAVCAGNNQQNALTIVNPQTGSRQRSTKLPFGAEPFSVTVANGECWATNDAGVFQLDQQGRVRGWSRLPGGDNGEFDGIAVGLGSAWVTIIGRAALLRVRY